jgi:hypothetical protein
MAGIEFPSSDGLCTRCPIQLRLSKSPNDIQVKVFLQPPSGNTNNNLPEPHTINSLDGLPDLIGDFMQKSCALSTKEQQIDYDDCVISDIMVVIDASGPDFPPLTLIDLPG